MKTSDILKGAIDLFKAPKKWTQGFYAYDAERRTCSSTSPDAVCYCLIGGVTKVANAGGERQYGPIQLALRFVNRAIYPDRDPDTVATAVWNDAPGRSVTEVRAVLRKAYRLALDSEAQAA